MDNTIILRIEDMSCGHCAVTVQEALLSVKAVKKAKVSLRKKEAKVIADPAVRTEDLIKAVGATGYRAFPKA